MAGGANGGGVLEYHVDVVVRIHQAQVFYNMFVVQRLEEVNLALMMLMTPTTRACIGKPWKGTSRGGKARVP